MGCIIGHPYVTVGRGSVFLVIPTNLRHQIVPLRFVVGLGREDKLNHETVARQGQNDETHTAAPAMASFVVMPTRHCGQRKTQCFDVPEPTPLRQPASPLAVEYRAD